MQYRNKIELQDRLAAEYVLGTLRGRARLRFQTWMREDAALRVRVHEWEARLAPMSEAIAPVQPPARVWRGIRERIGNRAPQDSVGWWSSLAFWRNWGLVVSGFAAALVVTLGVNPAWIGVIREGEVAKLMQPSYVAVLHATGSNEEQLMFMAYAARKSDQLWVKRVGLQKEAESHSYELWGLSGKEGEPPKSLGVIPTTDKGTMQLVAVADQSLAKFPALAISVEPTGGSKTGVPTGPVIAVGDCFNFW